MINASGIKIVAEWLVKGTKTILKHPKAWITGLGLFGLGIAGGYLLRQPQVNTLTEEVKRSQSENERLQKLIKGYHDQFVALKTEGEALKAMSHANKAKDECEPGKAQIMYLYASKEYIEILFGPRTDSGTLLLPEKQYEFYNIFKNVVNGETLNEQDSVKLQNYIYPKYKEEIEGMVEPQLNELLGRLNG